MAEATTERLVLVERYKDTIGWGWNTVAAKIGWAPVHIAQFRAVRIPIDDRWLEYLRLVSEAVAAVPVPEQTERAAPAKAVEDQMRAAGLKPGGTVHHMGQEVHVMLLDDIAAKLAEECRALMSDCDEAELVTARSVISRVAKRLGVLDQLRGLLAQPTPVQEETPPATSRPYVPPQPERAPFDSRVEF
jgi:hypothetical protein